MRPFAVAILVICLVFVAACTRHRVELEANEPIVIRVEARVDIYNHAAEIEDMVSGKQPIKLPDSGGDQSFWLPDPFASCAYAAEENSLKRAVARRKARYSQVQELMRKGIVGEDTKGGLSFRALATEGQKKLVREENDDRRIIYRETARQKKASLAEVERAFVEVHRKKAEKGTWIETGQGWSRK